MEATQGANIAYLEREIGELNSGRALMGERSWYIIGEKLDPLSTKPIFLARDIYRGDSE